MRWGGTGNASLSILDVNFNEAGAWPTMQEVIITNDSNTHTRSVVTPTAPMRGNNYARHGRIAVTGAGGNDRRAHVFTDAGTLTDFEILAELRVKGGTQPGIALRLDQIGDATNQKLYAVTFDAVFGIPDYVNLSVWKGANLVTQNVGTFTPNVGVFGRVEKLLRPFWFTSSSRTTNVVTLVVSGGHDCKAGDLISVKNGSLDVDITTITSVTPSSIVFTFNGGDNATLGSGWAGNQSLVAPMFIRARMIGATLTVKLWRVTDGEPSWMDPSAVVRFVDTGALSVGQGPASGAVGLMCNHHSGGAADDWGRIQISRVPTPVTWP